VRAGASDRFDPNRRVCRTGPAASAGSVVVNVVTFNLDEYYPMQPHELQSYRPVHAGAPVRSRRHRSRRTPISPTARSPSSKVHEHCGSTSRRSTRSAASISSSSASAAPGMSASTSPAPVARQPHAPDHARSRDARTRRATSSARRTCRVARSRWASARS
jgi:hypothetical protein